MKAYHYILTLVLSVFIFACQKETVKPQNEVNNTTVSTSPEGIATQKYGNMMRTLSVIYDPGLQKVVEAMCYPPEGNCFPDVTVVSSASSVNADVKTVLDIVRLGNQDDNRAAFELYEAALSTVMPGSLLFGVVDGQLTVINVDGAEDDNQYLIFYDAGGMVVNALPFAVD